MKFLIDFCKHHPLGAGAFCFIGLMLLMGIGAPWLAPFDPVETNSDAVLSAPSANYFFGTDEYGRDIYSRIIYGARTAMILAIGASLLGSISGAILGISAAYFGGWFDKAVLRIIDIMLSIPLIVFALVLAAVLGRKIYFGFDVNLIWAVAIPGIPKIARVVRSAALSVSTMPYINAARTIGCHPLKIIVSHMAPNLVAPWLVLATAFAAQAVLLEASLSFLGVGVAEPSPAWGLMLSGAGTQLFVEAPWMVIFPGLAVSLTVFSFTLLGDAVRDYLDPKFKF